MSALAAAGVVQQWAGSAAWFLCGRSLASSQRVSWAGFLVPRRHRVFVLFTLNRSENGGLGSVSVGLSEAVFFEGPAVVVVAVVSYFALRWLGWSSASLAT